MGYNFGARANEARIKSELARGREKINTNDILYKYGGNITLTDFEMVSGVDMTTKEPKEYPVCTFAENPNQYFNGGTALTTMCRAWLDDFKGDMVALRKEIQAAGGLHLRFSRQRSTTTGNDFIAVEFIEA